jgi:hypothetical protein
MEVMDGVPTGNIRTLAAIKLALEEAGIEFIGRPDDQPGVRLHAIRSGTTSTKQIDEA